MVKNLVKHIVANTYRPFMVKYLSKTRWYRYKNIRLEIPPEVFHPGFFFSTQLLLKTVNNLPLEQKRFLELGCGSGLIAIVAANKDAIVTATDINPFVVDQLKKNAALNDVQLSIIQSDLFRDIPKQPFDVIAINPPYYKKDPQTPKDHAWYCGENGEYFEGLFTQLGDFIHADTNALMVLFDGCDMDMILSIAVKHRYHLNPVLAKKNILEENYVFRIEKIN